MSQGRATGEPHDTRPNFNWGLVAMGGHGMDLVANLFGGADTAGARLVYGLVGLSALWQILPWSKSLKANEVDAEANRNTSAAR